MSPRALFLLVAAPLFALASNHTPLAHGQTAFADWNQQKPGTVRKITLADLPKPNPAQSVKSQPHLVARPQNAWPKAPAGYKVTLYAGGDNGPSPSPDQQHSQQQGTQAPDKGTFRQPRLIRTAPNGDLPRRFQPFKTPLDGASAHLADRCDLSWNKV